MLREQFIATWARCSRSGLVDLDRNGVRLAQDDDDTDRRVLDRVRASARRIATLVDDLPGVPRSHHVDDFTVEVRRGPQPSPGRLRQVVEEVRAAHPDADHPLPFRRFDGSRPMDCQRSSSSFRTSSRTPRARHPRDADPPVDCGERVDFAIKVTNQGAPIPEDPSAAFEPYSRRPKRPAQRARARALHRVGDCQGARRQNRSRIDPRTDVLHLQDVRARGRPPSLHPFQEVHDRPRDSLTDLGLKLTTPT